ncbi:hypothetical protein, partial [Arsenophonus nasoniae]|uniref:hypothetical protein n=1 Tax=Arsenophonus nasoniae TaxID=638 RepID=UPI00387A7204
PLSIARTRTAFCFRPSGHRTGQSGSKQHFIHDRLKALKTIYLLDFPYFKPLRVTEHFSHYQFHY